MKNFCFIFLLYVSFACAIQSSQQVTNNQSAVSKKNSSPSKARQIPESQKLYIKFLEEEAQRTDLTPEKKLLIRTFKEKFVKSFEEAQQVDPTSEEKSLVKSLEEKFSKFVEKSAKEKRKKMYGCKKNEDCVLIEAVCPCSITAVNILNKNLFIEERDRQREITSCVGEDCVKRASGVYEPPYEKFQALCKNSRCEAKQLP